MSSLSAHEQVHGLPEPSPKSDVPTATKGGGEKFAATFLVLIKGKEDWGSSQSVEYEGLPAIPRIGEIVENSVWEKPAANGDETTEDTIERIRRKRFYKVIDVHHPSQRVAVIYLELINYHSIKNRWRTELGIPQTIMRACTFLFGVVIVLLPLGLRPEAIFVSALFIYVSVNWKRH